MRRVLRLLIAVLMLVAVAGCSRYGVVSDGSAVALGASNAGTLLNPVELPLVGDGYWIPRSWVRRGSRYGTDELVRLVVHVGREIARVYPDSAFGVADLSPKSGGPSIWHRSHQNGLDVDLLFFAADRRGRGLRLDTMPHFRDDGSAWIAGPSGARGHRIYFDVERNWGLVRAVLLNPISEVQYIFVYEPLRQLLLDHAVASGEPWMTVLFASYVMRQPVDSSPHDDHFHVRIYCPESDRVAGACQDYGEMRWSKSERKYRQEQQQAAFIPVSEIGPMPVMWATGALPFHAYVAD